jgi:hypothetical protein
MTTSFLAISNRAVAYSDVEATSNPSLKNFDWALSIKNLSVTDPKSFSGSVPNGSSVTVFDGTRTTTLAGDTAFGVSLSSLDAGTRYRFTWSGGTNPTLRTDRALTLTGQTVTVTQNTDYSVNMSLGAGAFTGVVVGDSVFIPHTTTGDTANVFSTSNAGLWTVLAVISSTNLQLIRPAGASFEATAETVTLSSNSQLVAYSSAGVQVGDNVAISAGFTSSTRKTYTVDKITSGWFEVLSSAAIAIESSKTPTATGMIFYTDGKRFLHLEVDQESVVQLNGDTGENLRLVPVQSGDSRQPGWIEVFGAFYKLVIVNKSSSSVSFVAHSAR